MYELICRCDMNRDAARICEAVVRVLDLIGNFHDKCHEGTLAAELHQAGLLDDTERLPNDVAQMAKYWLSDTKGLEWVLQTFHSIFGTTVYPVEYKAGKEKAVREPELPKATPKPR